MGEPVSGVLIVFEDQALKRWSTRTEPCGAFLLALPPGAYRVRIDAPPFDPLEFSIRVLPPDAVRGSLMWNEERHFSLPIILHLRQQERVTVHGRAGEPSGTVDTLATGRTFARQDIETDPLSNGRTLQSFLNSVPGIVVTDSVGTLAQYTAEGQRRFANRVTVDGVGGDLGVDVAGLGIGQAGGGALPAVSTLGGTQTLVPLDAIEEISVHTSDATPEDRRTPGAQTTIVTRAGSDAFKGSVFADVRPNRLAAHDWFANAGTGPKSDARLTEFGASLGGPLVRKRLFYFGTWEMERIDRTIRSTIQVPSNAVRASAPPEMRALLDAFPRPNGPERDDGFADLSYPFPANSALHDLSLRADMDLSTRHHVFVRFNHGSSHGDPVDPTQHLPRMSYTSTETASSKSATLGSDFVIASDLANELRANVSTNHGTVTPSPASFQSAQTLPFAPFVPAPFPTEHASVIFRLLTPDDGIRVVASGVSGASRLHQIEFADSVSYVHARHSWRLGFDYRRLTAGTDPTFDQYNYLFAGTAGLLQGYVRSVTVDRYLATAVRIESWSAFVQDVLRVSPRLTLNYGVRYRVAPAPASLTAAQPLLLRLEALPDVQTRPIGSRLWDTVWTDIAPQVAATYQIRGAAGHETTLHTSWGLAYDEFANAGTPAFGRGAPYISERATGQSAFPLPPSTLTTPLPAAFAPGDRSEYFAFPSHFRSPRTSMWDFGADQALGSSQRIGVTYVGAAAHDLPFSSTYYIANPRPMVHAVSNEASSNYQALVAEYVRRLSRGWSARIAYTWSHAIDTDSGEPNGFETIAPQVPSTLLPLDANRGSANFDRRHVLNAKASFLTPSPHWPRPLRLICADWLIDVVGTVRSGAPLTVTAFQNLGPGFYAIRPDVVIGVPIWLPDSGAPAGQRLNPAAFRVRSDPGQGNLGRNTLRGFTLRQVDLALSRTVRVGRLAATVRLDAFNFLNVPNFAAPQGALDTPSSFGRSQESYANGLGTGTLFFGGLTPFQQTGGPRSIQVGARFAF